MAIDLRQKVKLNDDVLANDLGGESVLLNLESECYFGLEDVGTSMLTALRETDSVQEAYERLLQKYDVAPEQLQKDLLDLIEKMVEHGLVQVTCP